MGHQPKKPQDVQQRILIAQTAARIMAETGQRDFATVRRKAAEQHGIKNHRHLPNDDEIEAALREYQQIFQHHHQHQQLHQLRQTALQALKLLSPFSPRLVGPVLTGSADQHTPINLHLYADTTEQVAIFLMEHKIPFEQGEQHIRYAGNKAEKRPLFSFIAGESAVELTVFPATGIRQHPISGADGRPVSRANRLKLQQLINDEVGCH